VSGHPLAEGQDHVALSPQTLSGRYPDRRKSRFRRRPGRPAAGGNLHHRERRSAVLLRGLPVMQQVGFHGTLTSFPNKRPAVIALLLELGQLAAQSPGCLLFLVDTAVDKPNVVWTTEIWRSPGEHDACANSAETAKLADRIVLLLDAPPDVLPFAPVGAHLMGPYHVPERL
jgi:quinol monooxygenase YgiN